MNMVLIKTFLPKSILKTFFFFHTFWLKNINSFLEQILGQKYINNNMIIFSIGNIIQNINVRESTKATSLPK